MKVANINLKEEREMTETVSVIIPSCNEQLYLEPTIKSVLDNAHGEIEIIVILDGWEPSPPVSIEDDRIVYIRNEKAIGQRHSINKAVNMASGKYIMKLDAHCAVGPSFDVILARDCKYEYTMIPRMYNLDVETWEPKHLDNYETAVRRGKVTDYMFIGWKNDRLRTLYYSGTERKQIHLDRKDIMIDEIMSCMGPCFFMHKARFLETEGCDERHGHWGQQGIEVALKAWLSGGKLMVNKNTWFAHFFRGGGVPEGHQKGFPFPISQQQVDRARTHSEQLWLNNAWGKQTRTLEWLVRKFNAPTWEKRFPTVDDSETKPDTIHKSFFKHMISADNYPRWMGVKMMKYPTDLILYQQVLAEKKPDLIIEVGSLHGGSALFFAGIFELLGTDGKVLSIDINHTRLHESVLPGNNPLSKKRILFYEGRSTEASTIEFIREYSRGKKVMVILDGNHHRKQVKRELVKYGLLVSPGQYMVAEDTIYPLIGMKDGPDEAVEWFLKKTKDFVRVDNEKQFLLTTNPGGWLLRK